MAISRLIHVNNASSPVFWQLADAIRAIRGSIPGAKLVNGDAATFAKLRHDYGAQCLICRLTLDDVSLMPTPRDAADRWYAATWYRLAQLQPIVDYVEVPVNEAHAGAHEIGPFAEATARYVQLAAQLGIRCIIGNFSTGTPEPQDVPMFAEAIEAALYYGGAMGLHEYGLPDDMAVSWHIGRWVRFYDALAPIVPDVWRLPLFLTEFGIDGGNEGRERRDAGWRAYGLSGAQYADWLTRALHEEDVLDNGAGVVAGCCLFNCGDY